jgi:hypothetical protein
MIDEVNDESRILYTNEELHNLHSSTGNVMVIKIIRMTGIFGTYRIYEVYINAYRILVWKFEGKRSVEKPYHRWEVNIQTDHT